MKVLIVRARYTDPAIRKIAKSLNENGYDVTLLIWDRSGKRILPDEKNDYKVDYFCLRSPQDKLSIIFFLPLWWIYEFCYILKNNPDIIHACDFDTQYPAILAKIVKHKKLVYIIYDFYANNLPNGKLQWIRNVIRSLVARIEKLGIRFADLLILVDESRFEEVNGATINKIIYLLNSPEEIDDQKNQSMAKKQEKSIIIFYVGIIDETRGIEDIIAAVNEINDVLLILAGPEVNKSILNNRINEKIKYIGWIPTYNEVIAKTKEADILFRFSDPRHPNTRYASPNKLFEAMMCGKPIIVSDKSSMAEIVRKEKCGIVVPFGDVETIKEVLINLRNDAYLRRELGKNGRNAYVKKYSWKIMEKRLIDAYKNFGN